MVRVLLLLATALAISGQPALRVAFLGTSVTCGSGAAARFLPLVVAGLEAKLHRKVQTYDLCFGGAHSFTTLLLLKHTAIPWRPDLAVVETGALDGFAPALSAPAIEQILHALAEARIPAVFLARPARCSEENVRPVLRRLTQIYGFPLADIRTANLADDCHPSDEGHAQIAQALLAALGYPTPPPLPRRAAPLPNARFRPAAQALIRGVGRPVPLTFFRESGTALEASPGLTEWRFQFDGSLAAVQFRLSRTPASMQYQIDDGPWKSVPVQPYWFLNYYLETHLRPGTHQLGLRIGSTSTPTILDGLQTNP
jgi:hypothetical protein